MITITWESGTEKLTATVDHAMLIVPAEGTVHRAYVEFKSRAHLGEMLACVLAMVVESGDDDAFAIAMDILQHGVPGEFLRRTGG